MTLLCQHRVNSTQQLRNLAPEYGVEFDLRDHPKGLILAHDPWSEGEEFSAYLRSAGTRFLIVNVKSEGVEVQAREKLAQAGIVNYFFLDLSIPALVKMAAAGETRLCARFSLFEPREQVRALRKLVSWVWADYFDGQGISVDTLREFRDWGLKTCLVSPELLGRPENEVREYAATFRRYHPDMVCTKNPSLWKMALE